MSFATDHALDKMCETIRNAMFTAGDAGAPCEQLIDEAADAVGNAADDLRRGTAA